MVKEDSSEKTVEEEVVGGIWATGGKDFDGEKFEFDWPSEEIRRACEEIFGTEGERDELPVLNWISDEIPRPGSQHDRMSGIEHS